MKFSGLLAVMALISPGVALGQEILSTGGPENTPANDSIVLRAIEEVNAVKRDSVTSSSRKITPVDDDEGRPAQPVLHRYDKHGEPLPVPVLYLEDTDTVKTPSARSPYALFNGMNVGVNFIDAIMMLAGQKHAGFDVAVDVSLHNWFFPTLEAGVGFASDHPEESNFRYRCEPSPYLKLGVNYNFLYKSNPAYQIWVGLRAGWSSCRYTITDVTIPSSYWGGEDIVTIPKQTSSSFYGEALVGLRVKIAGPVSLGWSLRYHFMLHRGRGSNSTPWYVPGYGTNSPLAVTFSLWYNFGSRPRRENIGL